MFDTLETDEKARAISTEKTSNLFDIRDRYCSEQIPFSENQFDLICLFGEYVSRIYNEVKKRALYVVQEHTGVKSEGPTLSRSPIVACK